MSSTLEVACTPSDYSQLEDSTGTEWENVIQLNTSTCPGGRRRNLSSVGRSLKQKGPSTFLVGTTSPANTVMSPGLFATFLVVGLFACSLIFSSCIVWFITERRKLNNTRKLLLKTKNEAANPVAKCDVSVQCDRLEDDVMKAAYSVRPDQITGISPTPTQESIPVPSSPGGIGIPPSPLGKSPLSNNPFSATAAFPQSSGEGGGTPGTPSGGPRPNPFFPSPPGSSGTDSSTQPDPGTPKVATQQPINPFRGSTAATGAGPAALGHHGGMVSPFASDTSSYNPQQANNQEPAPPPGSPGTLATQTSSDKDTVHVVSTASEDMPSPTSQPSSSVHYTQDSEANSSRKNSASPKKTWSETLPDDAKFDAVADATGIHRTDSDDTGVSAPENDTLDRAMERIGGESVAGGSNAGTMNSTSSSHGHMNGVGGKSQPCGTQPSQQASEQGGIDGVLFQTAATGAAVTGQPEITHGERLPGTPKRFSIADSPFVHDDSLVLDDSNNQTEAPSLSLTKQGGGIAQGPGAPTGWSSWPQSKLNVQPATTSVPGGGMVSPVISMHTKGNNSDIPSTPMRGPGQEQNTLFNPFMDHANDLTEGILTTRTYSGKSSDVGSLSDHASSVQNGAGMVGVTGGHSPVPPNLFGGEAFGDPSATPQRPPAGLDLTGGGEDNNQTTPETSMSLAIGPQGASQVPAADTQSTVLDSTRKRDRWGAIQSALGKGLLNPANGSAKFGEQSGNLGAASGVLQTDSNMDMMLPPPPSGPEFGDFGLQAFGAQMNFSDPSSNLLPQVLQQANQASSATASQSSAGAGAHHHSKSSSVPNMFHFDDRSMSLPQGGGTAPVAPAASWHDLSSTGHSAPDHAMNRKPQQPYTEVAGSADISNAFSSDASLAERPMTPKTPMTPSGRSHWQTPFMDTPETSSSPQTPTATPLRSVAAPSIQPPSPSPIQQQQRPAKVQQQGPRSKSPGAAAMHSVQQSSTQSSAASSSDYNVPNLLDAPIDTPPASGSTFAIRVSDASSGSPTRTVSGGAAANGFTNNQTLPSLTSPPPQPIPAHSDGLNGSSGSAGSPATSDASIALTAPSPQPPMERMASPELVKPAFSSPGNDKSAEGAPGASDAGSVVVVSPAPAGAVAAAAVREAFGPKAAAFSPYRAPELHAAKKPVTPGGSRKRAGAKRWH